jgi:hypothetical protein
MRKLSINCGTTDSRETVGFNFKLETLRGDMWISEGDVNVASNTPEAQRTLELEGNQRLIITAIGADVETVYDRDNNANVTVAAFESMPDEAAKQATEAARQKELRDRQYGEGRVNLAADRAAGQERDRVLEEQRQREKEKLEQRHRDEEAAKQVGQQGSRPAPTPTPTPTPAPTPSGGVGTTIPPRPAGQQTTSSAPTQQASKGGMTAPGPSTGGQSSKDVKG